MAQLVGQNCILCGERIADELESRFCPVCGSPVHDKCMSPREGGYCSRCGSLNSPVGTASPQSPAASGPPSELQDLFSKHLKGWISAPWVAMRKSHEFHVFPAGAAPLDPAHIRTHESIVKLGRCFAIVGRPIAVLAFLVAAVAYSMTLGKETVIHTVLHVIGFLLMLPILFAIPVGLYFYGASLALLFTRYEFLTGPIGQKWLKVGGVKNPVTAKICYFLLLTIPLFLIYVIISAINQGIL